MENLKVIINFLDNYFKISEIEDKSWNGLQVEGSPTVEKIAFCVTAGGEVFEEVLEERPDLVIVHHGIFWKKVNPAIRSWMKERIEPLLETDTSLYAVHLPLDKHEKVGNNVQILKNLSVTPTEKMADDIGWIGNTDADLFQIVEKMEETLDKECKLLNFGPEKIKKVGVVSGSGGGFIYEALEKNLDLLITGEERDIAEVARDGKINVLFLGHYASETLGIIALKKRLQKEFSVKTIFLDFPTSL